MVVKDTCDPPNSITKPTLANKVYTVTDSTFPTYTVDDFTIDPDYCTFEVTYNTSPLDSPVVGAPDTAIAQGTGANERDFDVSYNFEINPLSQTQKTVMEATSVTIYDQENASATQEAEWTLSFEDPCLLEDMITITNPGQTNPDAFNFDGSTKTFNYASHTFSPDWCQMEIACTRVEGPSAFLDCASHDLIPDMSTDWTFGETEY